MTPHKPINQDSFGELNEQMEVMRKIVQENWHKTGLEELDTSDRENFVLGESLLDFFLWKVCLHETHQLELAATVVTETRLAFFALLQQAGGGPLFQRITARATLILMPANAWLFLHARTQIRKLKIAAGPLMMSMRHDRLTLPKGLKRDPDPFRARLAGEHCRMRTPGRHPRTNKQGIDDTPAALPAKDQCARACDLLVMVELGFQVREMALTLDLARATVFDRTVACNGENK